MKYLIFSLVLFTVSNALSQNVVNPELEGNIFDSKTAIINDPDGYTNIRQEQLSNSEIIGKLYNGEFFRYWPKENQNWLVVYKHDNLYGYVHKSRILDLDDVSNSKFEVMCDSIFSKELDLQEHMLQSKSITKDEAKRQRDFHELKYSQILRRFTTYVLQTKDSKMVNKFLETISISSGDEVPSFYLGELFLAEPNWIVDQVRKHPKGDMDRLVWGFKNVIYDKDNDYSYHIKLLGNHWYEE